MTTGGGAGMGMGIGNAGPGRGRGAIGGCGLGFSWPFLHLHWRWQGEQYAKNDGVHGLHEHGGQGGQFLLPFPGFLSFGAQFGGINPGIAICTKCGTGTGIAMGIPSGWLPSPLLEAVVVVVVVVVVSGYGIGIPTGTGTATDMGGGGGGPGIIIGPYPNGIGIGIIGICECTAPKKITITTFHFCNASCKKYFIKYNYHTLLLNFIKHYFFIIKLIFN